MKEFVIKSFRYGLDTRREQLTSQPGTLVVGENAFVNIGGEMQKRLAFVSNGDLSVLDSNGDTGTFGLEVTSVGLVTFGSALPSTLGYASGTGVPVVNLVSSGVGATANVTAVSGVITAVVVNAGGAGYVTNDYVTVTSGGGVGAVLRITAVAGAITAFTIITNQQQKQPVLASALPAGYTYIQLKHPMLTDALTLYGSPYGTVAVAGTATTGHSYQGSIQGDETYYDRTKHRITALLFSNNFNGNAFVAVTFADGISCLYYNGIFVQQSYAGILMGGPPNENAQDMAITVQLERQFMALNGWGACADSSLTPISAIGLTVDSATGGGSPVPNKCFIAAPSSTAISAFVTSTSTVQGIFSGAHQTGTTVAVVPPTATFTVAGAGGKSYLLESTLGVNGIVSLTGAAVGWAVDNSTTAAAIVTAVNLLTAMHGYSASNAGAVVSIFAPFPSSPTLNILGANYSHAVLTVTSTDATAAGSHAFLGAYNFAFGEKATVWVGTSGGSGWLTGDTWSIAIAHSTQGNITIGKGNISGQSFTYAMKLGNREFLGCGSFFAFSSVAVTAATIAKHAPTFTIDPTGWEEQNIGAGTISYVNQYGVQDTVQSFSHLQGKLAVFGQQSIQMWTVDADPGNFALTQTLDNTGTLAPFSVQAKGDDEVYYIDSSGIRSLKVRVATQNAYPDDVGAAIDLTIRSALIGLDTSTICSVIEPVTRQLWEYVNGNIYVLSDYITSKIVAWSTFKPTFQATDVFRFKNTAGFTIRFWYGNFKDARMTTYVDIGAGATSDIAARPLFFSTTNTVTTVPTIFDTIADNFCGEIQCDAGGVHTFVSNQTAFTPTKFVVFNKQVYVRASSNIVYLYGGTNGTTYDNCQPAVEPPWLDIGTPEMMKDGKGVGMVISGEWTLYASMQPKGSYYTPAIQEKGSATTPNSLTDSVYDSGHYKYEGRGTHLKLRAVGAAKATSAKLSSLTFLYDPSNIK